ncbi:GNAT family N-acetyltransferase [Nocardioides sp.]|uniref:GNAT family N-acetyltransferase n=1 Tax=Nocardioides sp. TaxID=35761 RepID=UPI001A2F3C9C|nr:GNAT family N-acetyltransferase [Nocardioides sp.]MBJ7359470.1 GNAT family N-acetyltransferase [Nocardioides sp.]
MLWRVRTTLPDRPGALALLAEQCGLADVNILGLQIFPGVEAVTDELVLRTPEDWEPAQIGRLVEGAGGSDVVAMPCSEDALADQATLYVQAARMVLERPMTFPEVVGRLFDARLESVDGSPATDDVMEMTVGDVEVQVRRATAFTATEHARGAAMAALVSDVLARSASPGISGEASGRRVGGGAAPAYAVEGDSVAARIDDVVVGRATLAETDEAGVLAIGLGVDPAWQRRGIGSRLLVDAARLALAKGADEILLTTRSDNQAALPMVLAAGLRGRIRMAGDQLTVRIAVHDLKPLRA